MVTRQRSENRDCHKPGHSSEIGKQRLPQTWPVVRNLKTGIATNMATRQKSENRHCHKHVHSSEIPHYWGILTSDSKYA